MTAEQAVNFAVPDELAVADPQVYDEVCEYLVVDQYGTVTRCRDLADVIEHNASMIDRDVWQ